MLSDQLNAMGLMRVGESDLLSKSSHDYHVVPKVALRYLIHPQAQYVRSRLRY